MFNISCLSAERQAMNLKFPKFPMPLFIQENHVFLDYTAFFFVTNQVIRLVTLKNLFLQCVS